VCELTEAIVNPANVHLRHGSGAARAIADAAGPVLDEECRQYIDQHGPLTVAEPMHTSAGRLAPAIQYVIHVAGPQSAQHSSPEQQQLCHQRLKQAFTNCLLYANSVLRVHSVSVPAISSGNSLAHSCWYHSCYLLSDSDLGLLAIREIDVVLKYVMSC